MELCIYNTVYLPSKLQVSLGSSPSTINVKDHNCFQRLNILQLMNVIHLLYCVYIKCIISCSVHKRSIDASILNIILKAIIIHILI